MSGPGCRVKIHRNAADAEGRMMVVPGTWDEFLAQATKKLVLERDAQKAFSRTGAILDDVDVLRDEDDVFVSCGEPFYKSDQQTHVYRIAVMGPGGVGKSCITIRYVKNTFVESYDPTIEDAFRNQSVIDDAVCVLEILDTAGQEEFKCLAQQWIEGKDGFLLVYSVLDHASFEGVTKFYELVHKEHTERGKPVPPVMLVGNKADLAEQRRVTIAEAQRLCETWREVGPVDFIECSARTGNNVAKSFEQLVRLIRSKNFKPGSNGNGGAGNKSKKVCLLV